MIEPINQSTHRAPQDTTHRLPATTSIDDRLIVGINTYKYHDRSNVMVALKVVELLMLGKHTIDQH
jgi:hypothetical protein